jgi:integrase
MQRGRLTQADVGKLGPGFHADGQGLYLQIKRGRSWLYRYELNGKQHWVGLGPADAVTLAHARSLRDKLRARVKGDKVDIAEERRRERAAKVGDVTTFRKAAEDFIGSQRHWKHPTHAGQWRSSLETYAYTRIGSLSVSEISRTDVIAVLEPIWLKLPETARRIRSRIENVIDWCIARGLREGDNPALRGPIVKGLPKQPVNGKVHHAAMPYRDVPGFMKALRHRDGIAALALQFAILTAARTAEVIGAKWSEINRADGVWIVPAERMKAAKEHRVPLTNAAMEVLERAASQGVQSEYVFSNDRGGQLSNMAMLALMARADRDKFTVHGFRSSFKTWAREETDFDSDLSEAALAHTIKNKVEAAYNHGTLLGKRRELMKAWADYCEAAP